MILLASITNYRFAPGNSINPWNYVVLSFLFTVIFSYSPRFQKLSSNPWTIPPSSLFFLSSDFFLLLFIYFLKLWSSVQILNHCIPCPSLHSPVPSHNVQRHVLRRPQALRFPLCGSHSQSPRLQSSLRRALRSLQRWRWRRVPLPNRRRFVSRVEFVAMRRRRIENQEDA